MIDLKEVRPKSISNLNVFLVPDLLQKFFDLWSTYSNWFFFSDASLQWKKKFGPPTNQYLPRLEQIMTRHNENEQQ